MRACSLLLLGAACGDPSPADPPAESAAPVATALTASPDAPVERAPAALLLAELDASGYVTVHGTVAGEFWVDLDALDDETWAFRVQVLDEDGRVLYAHTRPSPVQVRDFLGYYSDASGIDILATFTSFGDFPVFVPLLDGAARARFQWRDADGAWVNVGSYTLDALAADDQGTSELVTGTEVLHDAAPPEQALDIAILGDGFTEDELDTFAAYADTMADAILSTPPLDDYADRINLYRVDVVSPESGVSYDCVEDCRIHDNAFGSVFPIEWVNDYLDTDYNSRAIFQTRQWEVARAASVVPWDLTLIIANSGRGAGMAIHVVTVTTGLENFGETSVHELGHLLGQLGDEYVTDACITMDHLPANIASDPQDLPWAAWVDADTPLPTPEKLAYADAVGAFAGAYNCEDLYRPQLSCRMEDSDGGDFCAVCREQLVLQLYRTLDLADGLALTQDSAGVTLTPTGNVDPLTLSLSADGVEVATGAAGEPLTVPWSDLRGAVEVTARVAREDVLLDDPSLSQTWAYTAE